MPTPVWYLHFPSLAQCPLSLALFEGSYINRLLWRWPKRTQPWPQEKVYCMFVRDVSEKMHLTPDGVQAGHKAGETNGDTPAFEHITLPGQGMTWHDMACTLLCHSTRDTPLKDKFTQHLLSKCCPSLTSPLSPLGFDCSHISPSLPTRLSNEAQTVNGPVVLF